MKQKVTVTVDEALLRELDGLVAANRYENRSVAVESAIALLRRHELDAQFERALDALTPEDVREMQEMADAGLADYAKSLEEQPW